LATATELAEREGKLAFDRGKLGAQALVLLQQRAVAMPQRVLAGPLARRHRPLSCSVGSGAQLLDLLAQLGLGVEPLA
jgi:hypothetical protein